MKVRDSILENFLLLASKLSRLQLKRRWKCSVLLVRLTNNPFNLTILKPVAFWRPVFWINLFSFSYKIKYFSVRAVSDYSYNLLHQIFFLHRLFHNLLNQIFFFHRLFHILLHQIPLNMNENLKVLPFSTGSLNSGCVSDPQVLSPAIPSCPIDALTTVWWIGGSSK